MHLRPQLSSIRSRFGYPYHLWWHQEFDETGYGLVQKSAERGRFHDVTLLIESINGCFALMSKHSYPPGIFRSPSGGVNPGEDIAAGALREAHEETGLRIELQRFMAHITLDITHHNDLITWDSYIFHATTQDRHLKPVDLKEVQDTLWVTEPQMDWMIGQLRSAGSGGLNYRGNLTELSLWTLHHPLTFRIAESRDQPWLETLQRSRGGYIEDIQKGHWWIALVDGKPAGALGLIPREDCVEMTGLVVEPSFENKGLRTALVEYVCDQWRDPSARSRMKGLNDRPSQEPLWLLNTHTDQYLSIDFDLMDAGQAPSSLQSRWRQLRSQQPSRLALLYRSQPREL